MLTDQKREDRDRLSEKHQSTKKNRPTDRPTVVKMATWKTKESHKNTKLTKSVSVGVSPSEYEELVI